MKSRFQCLAYLSTILVLAGCLTQSINLYSLGFSKFDRLRSTSGRVGVVVMYRGGNAPAIEEGTAAVLAFENALELELRSKGYSPVALHTGTFTTAINRIDPPPSLRVLSDQHLKSAFAAAAAHELPYLLVVWLELKKKTPAKIERIGAITEITRAATLGWEGLFYVEAYSSQGEQLTMNDGVIRGWFPTKSDQFVVIPLDELAAKGMRTCLWALPHSGER